jgi:tetratricopeptide (TPR) repeat protein
VLVTVLGEMGPRQQPEIFYPLGMYKNQAVLQGQIKNLERAVSMDPGNADMHLLLGYHYLGIGKLDEAKAAIAPALNNKNTQIPAQMLITLIEQVKQSPKVLDTNSIKK